MQDSAPELRRIDWGACCSCTQLFRAFRISVHHFQLLLALGTVLAMWVVGAAMDRMAGSETWVTRENGEVVASELTAYASGGYSEEARQRFAVEAQRHGGKVRGMHSSKEGVFAVLTHFVRHSASQATGALLSARWLADGDGRPGFFGVVLSVPASACWLFRAHFLYGLIFVVLCLIVFGFGGGAVYRMAAMQATRNEAIPVGEAISFARSRILTFVVAPLVPWTVFLGIGLLLLVGGVIARLPVLDFAAGVVWFLPLLGGLGMAVAFIAGLGMWPLIFPAVAVDAADVFEAASRSFGYVGDRRWKTPFYYLVSLAYGAICLLVIKFIAALTFWLTHAWVGAGMGSKLEAMWASPGALGRHLWGSFDQVTATGLANAATYPMRFWTMVFVFAIAGFALSFFCSSSTLIYLLLRRDVDGTDLEEAWVDEEQEDLFAPAATAGTTTPGETSTSLPVVSGSPPPDAAQDGDAHSKGAGG